MSIPIISRLSAVLRWSAGGMTTRNGQLLLPVPPLISNIGHNELWQALAPNSLSVTLKMLWSLSITNCRSNWLQMVNFLSQFNHKMANLATLLKVCLHLKQNKHRSAHIIVGKAHNIHEVTTFLKSQRGVKIITKIFLH